MVKTSKFVEYESVHFVYVYLVSIVLAVDCKISDSLYMYAVNLDCVFR